VKKYDEVNSAPAATANEDPLDEGTSGAFEDGSALSSHEPIEIPLFFELPLESEASAGGVDVQGITDADLIGLCDSPEKEAEIEKRLAQTPDVNQLSYRFLVVDEENHDGILRVLEALVLLIKNLLKDQRIRRIPRQPGDRDWNVTLKERIEMAVCLRLLPIKVDRTANEITLLALQGAFSDVAIGILAELKVEANSHRQAVRTGRKASIRKSPSLDFVIAIDEQGHGLTFGDTVGSKTFTPRCALGFVSTFDEAIEFVSSNRDQIAEAIGDRAYSTLLVFIDFVGQGETISLGDRESDQCLTEFLQKRGVSAQQARKDKRTFRKAIKDALNANNAMILELVDLLRKSRKTIFEDLVS
jgi:hypothetical protein